MDLPQVGATTLGWAVAGVTLASVATGGFAVFLAAAVDPVALNDPLFIWGTYCLAGALGMAFVFTPSGLGAREAVQLPLFSLVFSPEVALAVVVISRLAEVVLDVLFYSVSALIARASR